MLKKFLHSKYAFPITALLVLVLAINFGKISDGVIGFFASHFESKKPPLLKLDGKTVEVPACQYLGTWRVPDGAVKTAKSKSKGKGKDARAWRDIVRLTYDDSRQTFQIDSSASLEKGSIPQQMTPDSEARIFKNIRWNGRQVSLFAFRALAPAKQTVVLEIDTDNIVALYINGKFIREMSATDNAETGANLLVPASLEAGENVFTVKIFSRDGQPRLRMGLTLDQSKDFQAASNSSRGFLTKLIYNQSGDSFETPVVRWDALLRRMNIGVEVHDVLNGKSMFTMDTVRSGNMIRDDGKVLAEGIYKITYKSLQPEQETFGEYFLVGSAKKLADALTETLGELAWSAAEKLNVEAQLRRVKVLFAESNYRLGDRDWEEKVLWTLGNLAEFINLKKVAQAAESAPRGTGCQPVGLTMQGDAVASSHGLAARATSNPAACATTDIFKGMTGLRLRGFVSKIDNSRQFYRLYVPSYYKVGDKLPLLLIMPTTMSLTQNARPFLESPFVAAHNQALKVSAFAEKHGFAVLWPGYRNAPRWWTYECVHAEEALEDVEKNYGTDNSKISLYGTCAGGFFAGRLASTYPNRFAAIVFDRAIFEREPESRGEARNSTNEWIKAINPPEIIIANQNIKIFVLNDGSRGEQHGAIALSRQFLGHARAQRSDIKSSLGQRKIGVGLWDLIFEFLAGCKNGHPDGGKADVPAASGFAGPISEVFATPFIVVEGTHVTPEEGKLMDATIKNLEEQYHGQFFDAEFVLKKDTEITDEEIEKYSLMLVGNAESNTVWGRLAAKYAVGMTPYVPADDWSSSSTESVFAEVFKNPANKGNYLLLIGSARLNDMRLLKSFNPFTACFDSYVLKYHEGHEREYITARRP